MTKLVANTGINVAGSLKMLGAGECLTFPATISETVVRSTCTRIKNATGMRFSVNRQNNGTHIVTRTF